MQSCPSPFGGLSRYRRIGLVLIGAMSLGLLSVAAALRPNDRGWGTHQQLGLPACTIQQLYGWRCPTCGMTTAWAHFVRGDWIAALSCNVGGTLLALACAVAVPWTIGTAIRGDWIWLRPTDNRTLGFCVSILTVTVGDWLVRLTFF
jgi:hypothetical protein